MTTIASKEDTRTFDMWGKATISGHAGVAPVGDECFFKEGGVVYRIDKSWGDVVPSDFYTKSGQFLDLYDRLSA